MTYLRAAITLSFFILGLFSTGPAFARSKTPTASKTVVTKVVDETPATPPASRFHISTEIDSLSGLQSGLGAGVMVGYAYRLTPNAPVYFGMDMGVRKWTADYTMTTGDGDKKQTLNGKDDVTSIPILATLQYRFFENNDSKAHPYLGFSLGPDLVSVGNENIKLGDRNFASKSTDVKFEVLFRPGVEIDITDLIGIAIEPKVGILDSHLLFAPQFGITFQF